jgi:hypothetical protein
MTVFGFSLERMLPRFLTGFIVLAAILRASGSEELDVYRVAELTRSNSAPVFRGGYNYLARSGQYLLVTRASGVQILDVSVPESPREASSLVFPNADHISVQGNLAVVGGGLNLRYIDIADPRNPTILTNQILTRSIYRLRSFGSRLYIVESDGLRVVDIATGGSPVLLGSTNFAALRLLSDVVVKNGRAWLVSGDTIRSLDVSQPALGFADKGSVTLDSFGERVEIAGDVLFVGGVQGLTLIDISNPDQPVLLGRRLVGGANTLAVEGDRLFVTHPRDGLLVFDISDPFSPVQIGFGDKGFPSNNENLTMRDLVVFPGYAWLAAWDSKLFGMAYRPSGIHSRTNSGDVPCAPQHFSASGEFVRLVDGTNLLTFSRQTLAPVSTNSLPERLPGTTAYAFSGNLGAELSSGTLTLFRADRGLPEGFLGSLTNLPGTFGTSTNDVGYLAFASTNRLLLSLRDGGLISTDVTDPKNPSILDRENPGSGACKKIIINGNRVAVEGSLSPIPSVVFIYRLETDGTLTPAGSVNVGFLVQSSMAIDGSILGYTTVDKLWAWSLNDDSATYVDRVRTAGAIRVFYTLLIRDGLAYVRSGDFNLEVFDMRAGTPVRIGGNTAHRLTHLTAGEDELLAIRTDDSGACQLVAIPYLPPPPLLSVRHGEGQALRLSVRAGRGARVRLERAASLSGWETWQRVTNQSEFYEISDTPEAGADTRFYRAVAE